MEQLDKELPEYYDFNHGIAKNDHHNTVVMRMNTRLPNAWTFINEEEKGDETGTTLGSHNQARVVFTQQEPTLCYRLCCRHSVGRVLDKHS